MILTIIYQYLLLLLPLGSHLYLDRKGGIKGTINHTVGASMVLGLSILVGFLLPGHFWQGALYALSIHLFFFDFLYNPIQGHPMFYHGDPNNPKRALTDRLWAMTPVYGEVFLKLVILWAGIGVYYYLDKIISYY